jgi:hypothetical protein
MHISPSLISGCLWRSWVRDIGAEGDVLLRKTVLMSFGSARSLMAAYVGANRFVLYGIADCELHAFVESDAHKKVQRSTRCGSRPSFRRGEHLT